MSFLDELDQRPRAANRSVGRSRERQRAQAHMAARRRTVLLIAVAVLVIALALAISGLRDNARVNGFRSYGHAAQALLRDSNRQGAALVAALSSGSSLGPVQVESQANGLADDSSALVRRAHTTAHPAELAGAQADLVEVLGFRRDAFATVARLLPAALGDSGNSQAAQGIAAAMQTLLASDVIVAKRVGPELRAELRRQRVTADGLFHGRSLSDPNWVSASFAATKLGALRTPPAASGSTAGSGAAGTGGSAAGGTNAASGSTTPGTGGSTSTGASGSAGTG